MPCVGGGLTVDETGVLRELLVAVLPYPDLDGGPNVDDTVVFIGARLGETTDQQAIDDLLRCLARAHGREVAWVEAAAAPGSPDHAVFERLLGWAWDGFLADPRWGVNRGGLGWAHVGSAGPPRRRS